METKVVRSIPAPAPAAKANDNTAVMQKAKSQSMIPLPRLFRFGRSVRIVSCRLKSSRGSRAGMRFSIPRDAGDPFCYEQRHTRAAFKPRGPAHARLLVRPCGLRPVLAGTGGLRRSVVFCFAEASRADLFRERFPASGSTRKSAGAAQLGTGGSCAKVALRSGASANECLSVPQPQLAESRRSTNEAMCHVWTAPSWQGKTSRRRLGRCSHVFGLLTRFT